MEVKEYRFTKVCSDIMAFYLTRLGTASVRMADHVPTVSPSKHRTCHPILLVQIRIDLDTVTNLTLPIAASPNPCPNMIGKYF